MKHGNHSVYLTKIPRCKASVTYWSMERNDGECHIRKMDHGGPGDSDHRLPQKDQNESYYTGGQKS